MTLLTQNKNINKMFFAKAIAHGVYMEGSETEVEINKIIILRSDTNLVSVSREELTVLLDQLKNEYELNNINISNNFLKEILKLAIIGLEKSEKEINDYDI